ncbi:T9SS type A sorting domain-containing protein [Vaginella massiliensis]|uniref:T9SS type A sorting domain-containing protein n=1 Tax=Vaginella massiliensis TaxID=1816680 RepID=UPI00375281DF
MKKYLLIGFLGLSPLAFSQYVSPGTGITLKIQDIAEADPTAVSLVEGESSAYFIHQNITISANDTFVLDEDLTFYFKDDVLWTVAGTINLQAPKKAVFTVENDTIKYQGFRLEQGSNTILKNISIFYSGGIRALGGDFVADNCNFSNTHSGISTGGVLSFSRGVPVIKNSRFQNNETPAIGSAANANVGLVFENNYLYNNNSGNTNRPQINMGPSGEGQIQYIRNNTIIGNRENTRVGGIASSSLLGADNTAVIEGNTIKDNRYGITLVGVHSGGEIIGNTIVNNDSEGIPNIGGSGISISQIAESPLKEIKIFDNYISGHLWGITLIGNGTKINLGDENRSGENIIIENGNNEVPYALYNNSANDVTAQGNFWTNKQDATAADVEAVIFHQADDASLGWVDYSNFYINLATENVSKLQFEIYPNPVDNVLNIQSGLELVTVEIINANGQVVLQSKKTNAIAVNTLAPGVYLVKITDISGNRSVQKFIKK